MYSLNKTIEYFRIVGNFAGKKNPVYHFKYFNQIFHKKRVRVPLMYGMEENALFNSIFLYVRNTLIIMDDCKVCFADGMKKGHTQLFSRSNHTGRESTMYEHLKKGVDIVTIWHHPDHVNKNIWDFSTAVVMFKFPMSANYKACKNLELSQKMVLYL